jgi:UDPglucose 6-dehydrogenase
MPVTLSVIGCGYLGAVHAACMAELGHTVIGVDTDAAKVAALMSGSAPFFEPGLDELLARMVETGRLRFTTEMSDAALATVHFLAVGTPQLADSQGADLRYVDAAIESLLPVLGAGDLVVGKSTVPVGTAARLAARIAEGGSGAELAWNPEFLREGFALKDTMTPDRLVYGLPEGDAGARAREQLSEVYATALAAGTPLIEADYATAELVKVSANAFLATKISFINAMAEIAEVVGADVTLLADAIGHDARIGRRFLNAGIGFGGGCLPKDIRAFSARAAELGRGDSVAFLGEVDAINLRRRQRAVDLTIEAIESVGGRAFEAKVAVLGLAFKPDSDDVRDSPALDVATSLFGRGAKVTATDPQAIANARRMHPQLDYVETAEEAARGADAVVLVTEWAEYRALDPVALREIVASPIIVDGRNVLDAAAWRAAGWTYIGMGRR